VKYLFNKKAIEIPQLHGITEHQT